MKLIRLGKSDFQTIVDDCDFEWLTQYSWNYSPGPNTGYARRTLWLPNKTCRTIRIHTVVYGLIDSNYKGRIDHKNGDGLDNRRTNLRPATNAQNIANGRHQLGRSSQYRGVCWHKRSKKWRAQITKNKKTKWLGDFDDEKSAALVYDIAAFNQSKDYAQLNFPHPNLERHNDKASQTPSH